MVSEESAAARRSAARSDDVGLVAPVLHARHPRLAIAAMAIGAVAIGITETGTMGILPLIADGVSATIPQAGALVSAYAIGAMIGAPLLAILGARLPRRAMLLAFLGLYMATHLATLAVDSFGSVWVSRFLSGFPHGAYLGVASLVAADLVTPQRRAGAVAGVMLGFPVANLLGAPLGIALAQSLGWQALYVAVAAAAGLCALGIITTVPPTPRPAPPTPRPAPPTPRTAAPTPCPISADVGIPATRDADSPAARGGDPTDTAPGPGSELRVLRRPAVWLVLATAGFGFGGNFATMSYINPTVTTITGMPEAAVALVLAAYGVGNALGAAVAARLSRIGLARAVTVAFAAIMVVLSLLGWLASWPATIFPAVAALGTMNATIVAVLQTRVMEVALDGQTLAATLVQSAFNMGNAIGAWAGGVVLTAGFSYAWPSRAGALLAGLGVVFSLLSRAYGRRHPEVDLGFAKIRG